MLSEVLPGYNVPFFPPSWDHLHPAYLSYSNEQDRGNISTGRMAALNIVYMNRVYFQAVM